MYINYHFINSQHSMVNFIHGTTHLRFHGWENCTCIRKLLLNLILTNEKTNDISYKTYRSTEPKKGPVKPIKQVKIAYSFLVCQISSTLSF